MDDPGSIAEQPVTDPMAQAPDILRMRAARIDLVSQSVRLIELKPADGSVLPPFTAGAHIGLLLPNGLERHYSLINDQEEQHRYVIAVGRDAKSRGGSSFIHDRLSQDDTLSVRSPRNNFALTEGAENSVFIAGGIGITPFLSMSRRLAKLGRPWELHYCARSRSVAAFLPDLTQLAANGGRLHTHFDDEHGGALMDLERVVASSGPSSHLYCCGPAPMLAAFEAICADRPVDRIHVEYFSRPQDVAKAGGFVVQLARQSRSVYVPEGSTILDALLAAGLDLTFGCREGACGTCEVRVLEGEPDHRDLVLSDAERRANQTMMICCSGSRTPSLTLDL